MHYVAADDAWLSFPVCFVASFFLSGAALPLLLLLLLDEELDGRSFFGKTSSVFSLTGGRVGRKLGFTYTKNKFKNKLILSFI